MKKIILWSVLAIVLVAIAVAATLWLMRPQVIVLKDGTRLTFVGASYGKHHVFKGIKTMGSYRRGRTTLDTTNDTLVVWVEAQHKVNQWGNYQLLVYDTAETACVNSWSQMSSHVKNGVDVQGYVVNAFPRRDSKMILRIMVWGNNGQRLAKGQFVISNPGPRSFPEWHPDPMPDEQSDGDLNVTLTRCEISGRNFMFGGNGTSSKDPMHKGITAAFQTEQHGNVVTNWQPVAIETTDATGNRATMNSWRNGLDDDGDATMNYQWGLWPSEAAWHLRVEMSRTSGFADNETWSITNVPVGKGTWQDLWNTQVNNRGMRRPDNGTNSAFAETTINGIHLKFYAPIQIAGQNFGMGQTQGGFHVVADPDLPEGYRLSLVVATNEHGRKIQSWGPTGGNGNYIVQLPDMGDSKLLNLTIALHQSRFVEFTVKPTSK
jgi:hypothetical protein